jgi:hypothetical protein
MILAMSLSEELMLPACRRAFVGAARVVWDQLDLRNRPVACQECYDIGPHFKLTHQPHGQNLTRA